MKTAIGMKSRTSLTVDCWLVKMSLILNYLKTMLCQKRDSW